MSDAVTKDTRQRFTTLGRHRSRYSERERESIDRDLIQDRTINQKVAKNVWTGWNY